MRFLADHSLVSFPGLGWEFDVYATFLEIPFGDGVISIKFYGVIIAFGFILAALFGGRKAYTWKMSLDSMVDVLIYGIIGAVIGARLYYVIFQWDHYKNNLWEIFKIWEGGLAIHGAIIAVSIGIMILDTIFLSDTPIILPQKQNHQIHNRIW